MTQSTETPNNQEHQNSPAFLGTLGAWITQAEIDKTKEVLDQCGQEVLVMATGLRVLAERVDAHADDLLGDEAYLMAEDAQIRAAQYREAYLALVRIFADGPRGVGSDCREFEFKATALENSTLVQSGAKLGLIFIRSATFTRFFQKRVKHVVVGSVSAINEFRTQAGDRYVADRVASQVNCDWK